MPPAADRAPAPEQAFWPEKETLPAADDLRKRSVKLHVLCGRPDQEVVFAEPGYAATARKGYVWNGWGLPVHHCRADNDEVQIELSVPKGARGTVRVYVIDPGNFEGGRKEKVVVAGETVALVEKCVEGRWLERRIEASQTSDGKILVQAVNTRPGSNAGISIIEWVAAGPQAWRGDVRP